jgi:hypothetical protein
MMNAFGCVELEVDMVRVFTINLDIREIGGKGEGSGS